MEYIWHFHIYGLLWVLASFIGIILPRLPYLEVCISPYLLLLPGNNLFYGLAQLTSPLMNPGAFGLSFVLAIMSHAAVNINEMFCLSTLLHLLEQCLEVAFPGYLILYI